MITPALSDLLHRMGWIHWTERMPPNNPSKEILQLHLPFARVVVGPASDYHYRIQIGRERGAPRSIDWGDWWMPVPVPPKAIMMKMMKMMGEGTGGS